MTGNQPQGEPAATQFVDAVPFGWVYKLDRELDADKTIPAAAIVGMWRADAQGKPTGDFIPNPHYRPRGA